MRTIALPTFVTLALLGPAVQLPADGPAPPPVGDRVRVTAPAVNAERLVGTLEGFSSDTLSLRLNGEGALTHVPLEAVTKIEVSRGRRSIGKSALIGTGIGAVVGAVWYLRPARRRLRQHAPEPAVGRAPGCTLRRRDRCPRGCRGGRALAGRRAGAPARQLGAHPATRARVLGVPRLLSG